MLAPSRLTFYFTINKKIKTNKKYISFGIFRLTDVIYFLDLGKHAITSKGYVPK